MILVCIFSLLKKNNLQEKNPHRNERDAMQGKSENSGGGRQELFH